ncbi:hypothetical protein [Janthinobacterium sp. DSP2-3-3]|uniref:hypothetical protein n=1 Tax=Janthinobacterium sp. DSP2-3-3 TaxID=2804596 RepID=UPI003CE83875
MKKMTATEKKTITQDWKEAIGAYEIYKPLHLLKRNGLLLTGIYLKPVYGEEYYVPVFHTHSLMTPFPVVSLATLPDTSHDRQCLVAGLVSICQMMASHRWEAAYFLSRAEPRGTVPRQEVVDPVNRVIGDIGRHMAAACRCATAPHLPRL